MSDWDPAACQAWREEAAVALLSRRPVPAPARDHLEACPPCRDEIDELAALAPLLAARRAEGPPAFEPPSELLLPRLLAEAARRRRRRRIVLGAAAAAVVALALPAGIQLDRHLTAPAAASLPTPVGPVVARGEALDPVTGTRVEVEVRAVGAGSRVDAELYSVPGGARCHLRVIDRATTTIDTPSWVVPDRGYVAGQVFPTTVELPPGRVTAVDLVDDSTGRVMVHIPLLPV